MVSTKQGDRVTISLRKAAEKFKRAREEAGLTLRDLAEKAGLAPSTIQKIENSRLVPSLAVSIRLADALNRKVSHFVEEEEASTDVRLIRKGRGRVYASQGSLLTFERIAEPILNPRMEGSLITVAPGGQSGSDEPVIYRGEEIIVCTKGRLRFEIRGQEYLLGPGDTLHFKADIPHSWENPGSRDAQMISIVAFNYP